MFQEECFAALKSIAQKVNNRDADMRSHIVLSMFKVGEMVSGAVPSKVMVDFVEL